MRLLGRNLYFDLVGKSANASMQARACQLIGDSCASQTYSAQLQGESAARAAVHDANYRYATETGKNFNVENRPVTSGSSQNAWDDCNRIHRIYR